MSRIGLFIVAILSVMLLSLSAFAAEVPLQLTLRGPSDNSESENFRVEFIYGFNRMPTDIKSCTLWVDSAAKGTRQTLFSLDNNKISTELTEGVHTWQIKCNMTDGLPLESQQRTLTVKSQILNNKGYEVIYNNNGMRSYIVYASPGQSAVPLPGMKGGEEIRVRTSKSTHYIDLLKMGSSNGSYFAEIRDRTSRKIHKILVENSIDLDFDSDKTTDARITLEKTNNAVDAFFLVTPYPDSEIPLEETEEEEVISEKPIEQPEQEETQETPTQSENLVDSEEPTQPVKQPEIDRMPVVETSNNTGGKGLWIALGLIVLAIISVTMFLKKKPKTPEGALKQDKKQSLKPDKADKESFEVISTSSNKKK